MSGEREIGELSQTIEYVTTVEWTIKDIFSYTKENDACKSPTLTLPGSLWRLYMYPNGRTTDGSVGWISAYLWLDEMTTPKDVNFDIGVKTDDGSYEIKLDRKHVFNFKKRSSGLSKFLEKTDLWQRKHQLAPSGDLTLTCSMEFKDDLEFTSRFNKLSESLENMFISKRGCDATLKVQDKDFSVHRSILIARSPVLGAMFEVDMEEQNTGIVNIVDFHPQVFEDFLKYIYSGKFILSSKDVFQLYRIAHKYDVEQLKSDCVAFMMHNLSFDTLFDATVIGHVFDENELKNKTRDFFNREFAKIASTSKWKSFLLDNTPLAYELLKNMAVEMRNGVHLKSEGMESAIPSP